MNKLLRTHDVQAELRRLHRRIKVRLWRSLTRFFIAWTIITFAGMWAILVFGVPGIAP